MEAVCRNQHSSWVGGGSWSLCRAPHFSTRHPPVPSVGQPLTWEQISLERGGGEEKALNSLSGTDFQLAPCSQLLAETLVRVSRNKPESIHCPHQSRPHHPGRRGRLTTGPSSGPPDTDQTLKENKWMTVKGVGTASTESRAQEVALHAPFSTGAC